MYKFHEEINQHATCFTKKNQHVKAHEQNQLHDEKHEYTIFTKREINLQQVSRTKTSTQLVP